MAGWLLLKCLTKKKTSRFLVAVVDSAVFLACCCCFLQQKARSPSCRKAQSKKVAVQVDLVLKFIMIFRCSLHL